MSDIKHILWLLKQVVWLFLMGDFAGSKDAAFWIKIHLMYKSKRMDE